MQEDYQDDQEYFGTVIFFVRNFGFAHWEKDGVAQADIFLHFANIIDMPGYRTLKKNQKISFQLGYNNRGQLIAVNIKALSPA